MSPKLKKNISLTVIYLVVTAIISLLFIYGSLDSWQEKILDRFYTKNIPKQNIIILAVDDVSLHEIGQWPWPRSVFAEVLKKISHAKSIGIDVSFSESSVVGSADDLLLQNVFKSLSDQTSIVLPVQVQARGKIENKPLSIFSQFTKLGFVNVVVDSDGVIRNVESEKDSLYSFSSLLAGTPAGEIPQKIRIDYHGPRGTFVTLPLVDVLNGKVPDRIFNDAVVLIGVTADDLHDILNTPFGLMPGVEIHANIIETILDKNYRVPLSMTLALLILALCNICTLLFVTLIKRFYILTASLIGFGILVNVVGVILFSQGILFPHLYVTLSFILMSIIVIVFQYISESKDKKMIRQMFHHYLMPSVVEELVNNPKKLTLGGEKRKITIFFSDIRDFTAISESLSPEQLSKLINQYLTVMTDIIMKHNGLVDKYIGDAIMAFWGAPVENNNQVIDACRAIQEMSKALQELNNEWKKEGIPLLKIGVGLNVGEAVVGNFGSEKRFNYTALGDEVNFASRLEGVNKMYGTQCIVSESIFNELLHDGQFVLRKLDMIKVKGKKEPKVIFEFVTDDVHDDLRKVHELFEQGRNKYEMGDWKGAIEVLQNVLEIRDDGPTKTILNRCKVFIEHPPVEWHGVYSLESK